MIRKQYVLKHKLNAANEIERNFAILNKYYVVIVYAK